MFTDSAFWAQVSHRVAMSVCLFVTSRNTYFRVLWRPLVEGLGKVCGCICWQYMLPFSKCSYFSLKEIDIVAGVVRIISMKNKKLLKLQFPLTYFFVQLQSYNHGSFNEYCNKKSSTKIRSKKTFNLLLNMGECNST